MQDNFGRELQNQNGPFANYFYNTADNWEVTENTPRVPNPPAFKRYALMPYQLASIYTMHQMETQHRFPSLNREFWSTAGILSNSMGSGKTATILGLITFAPVPRQIPAPITLDYYSTAGKETGRSRGIVLRTCRRVIPITLIFVGYGVLRQWSDEIKKFNPTLRYFVVDGIAALKRFYNILYDAKQLAEYDAVLIKNKTITGVWEFTRGELAEDIVSGSSKYIYNVIAVMCRNFAFARLVVDDFDTIGLPTSAGNINALFTWFVSSTNKTIQNRTWINKDHTRMTIMVHNNNIAYCDVAKNRVLYTLFNVHVTRAYYETFASVGRPQFYRYEFKNANAKIVDLIANMNGDRVNEIMEALNADAIGDAARLANIEAANPQSILKALLQKNYERMANAQTILDHFRNTYDTIDVESLRALSDNPDPKDTFGILDIHEGRVPEYKYANLRGLLRDEKAKYEAVFAECRACLDKFKASVKNNECLVCCLELDDPDENFAIMPCCNEIIHADCAIRGCAFRKENATTIVGYCPFNKSHRVLLGDLCYIRGGFDLTKVDEASLTNVEAVEGETPAEGVIKPDAKRTKYDAAMDIVYGRPDPSQQRCDIDVPGLLIGNSDLRAPTYIAMGTALRGAGFTARTTIALMRFMRLEVPRVLIFANFDDTLDKMQATLTENHIAFKRLGGHMSHLNDQIAAFNANTIQVLLIKSTVHCSSLNLQVATDIVFLHQIIDPAIRSQVCGRLQRSGRTTNARIHFLLYDTEKL
jgi:hypothetical protein